MQHFAIRKILNSENHVTQMVAVSLGDLLDGGVRQKFDGTFVGRVNIVQVHETDMG